MKMRRRGSLYLALCLGLVLGLTIFLRGGTLKVKKENDRAGVGQYQDQAAEAELRERIGDAAFEVVVHGATERPFSGVYDSFYEPGIYVDVISGEPLFLSTDKYDAGCGWPAFSKPVRADAVSERTDTSHFLIRTEVRSKGSGAHLGHVFEDGPEETGGLRYCINSLSLRFIPLREMEEKGYGSYISEIRQSLGETETEREMEQKGEEKLKEIYLAGGCFWGMEAAFKSLSGVMDTEVGYANGTSVNPSYKEVCTGNTGHRETVRILYDPDRISLETLLRGYFMVIDSTVENRQGNDRGSQYQTGVYYRDEADLPVLTKIFEREKKQNSPFCVELEKLTAFYPAEEYHQDYLDKNPGGYCHISRKEMAEVRALSD